MEKVILTEEGYQELEKRLEYLKVTKRAEITDRIKVARDFGDLSENAEYDAAKTEQGMIEGEIIEIEAKLKIAQIIKSSDIRKDVVSVGSKVRVYDEEFNEEIEYEIVGTTEADIKVNRISNESPVGKALIGCRVGAEVKVNAPDGEFKLKILAILS